MGRGLAAGDLDNDGRVDVLLVGHRQPLAYFHNQSDSGHFLILKLEGSGSRSNRGAIGAKVVVTAGGRSQVAWRSGGGSFQSSSDDRLHFGLGLATEIDSVEVVWPSGRTDRLGKLPADSAWILREGSPSPVPLKGFREARLTTPPAKVDR
jgi:hypothetical protein